ncbi:hypothetical protein HWV62_6683 [Athelia sp. TMB]|nr:hypothetical protein HWV62_6683 [Athelia sp. TMB]
MLTATILGLISLTAVSGKSVIDLSGSHWTLTNQQRNVSIGGAVPSHAHLDLYAAGVIDDPLYGDNNIIDNWVAMSNWTYTSHPISGLKNESATYLVFNGIDTFANISLCNQSVGFTDNQFRQWIFDVSPIIASCPSTPILSLAFTSAPDMANYLQNPNSPTNVSCAECFEIAFVYTGREFIRKQQLDFGWNWAPAYTPTGIWQPAYVVQLASQGELYVTNSMVDIYRQGQLNNLPPDQTQPWVVNASIDYLGTIPANATFRATISSSSGHTLFSGPLANVTYANGTITGNHVLIGAEPELWWPVGHGSQTLYNMTVEVVSAKKTLASVDKRVGFRTIVLNQGVITPEQEALGIAPGANWHFEINGHEIFAKGSNLVPPDVFWPRVKEAQFRLLLDTAVAGNQNMLRVWGGGAYLPDYVYDIADEFGVMLWTEMQYSDAVYPVTPTFLENALAEANYQIRRINHHPSLAVWSGNNEVEYGLAVIEEVLPKAVGVAQALYEELFLNVLINAVYSNTRSISYLPSSITNGYLSLNHSAALPMVERFNNLSAGSVYGNSDYYNYDVTQAFNLSAFPVARFATEFGFQSHSSVPTYATAMPSDQLSFNSSVILFRNREYPLNYSDFFSSYSSPPAPLNITQQSLEGLGQMSQATTYHLPSLAVKPSTVSNFTTQIYSTQVFQSDFYRAQIAFYRRGSGLPQRTLGSLYWMLNDIWAAPTKASVEASGRWKMLHYGARDIYKPVIIAPYLDETGIVQVWATSDLWSQAKGSWKINWYDWSGNPLGNGAADQESEVTIGALNSTHLWTFNSTALPFGGHTAVAFLTVDVEVNGTKYSHTNRFFPLPLSEQVVIDAIQDPRLVLTHTGENTFTVKSHTVAAWVWLEHPDGVSGYFSDNGFWMVPGTKNLTFTVKHDTTDGKWTEGVTIRSLWSLTSS